MNFIDASKHEAFKVVVMLNIGEHRFCVEATLLTFADASFGF
ncbi:hypothetical protein CLV42_101880 [Chitinophaga ginsengisoli]|uniref:Uncharacterized protein n=1 Tax=Chitinophaga ginsengisoli TaxID=363837 RepID=A0A2P8GQ71_9BACT|nr:hypothetical protein [Chitinophaga ginsengisoli]PSL36111.1 hypothetical protein CLV42_101880 [Chitinophaga ginsengisoli]